MTGGEVALVDRFGCSAAERALMVRAAQTAAGLAGRGGLRVSLLLTDDTEIARLHGRFLADPSATDVLSFALDDGAEVVVNVEQAAREAGTRGGARADELALYVVHGVLHACGFDDVDPGERARMRHAEQQVLAALGVRATPVD